MVEYPIITYSERIWTIYVHNNKENNKKYIGITNQNPPDKRWGSNGRKYGKNINKTRSKFWNAIQKYGWDSFEHIILLTQLTHEEAKIFECYYIKIFDSKNNGYNMTEGGDGSKGCHPSEETRRKISISNLAENLSPETRRKLSESHKLKNLSAETRRKQREAYLKRTDPYVSGWHHSPEAIEKLREASAWRRKKIICLNNFQEFDCARSIGEKLNINKKAITNCCRGKTNTSGEHPITKERLHWIYKDIYEQLSDEAQNGLK